MADSLTPKKAHELAKNEGWRKRYWISLAVLVFFGLEYNRLIESCIEVSHGCHDNLSTEALISATEQGLFWSFAVVILGRAAQPLINRIAFFKFGGKTQPQEDEENAKS